MKFVFCWLQLFLLLSGAAYAVDVEDFSEINGYTVIDITYVEGDFEGADYDRPVILERYDFSVFRIRIFFLPTTPALLSLLVTTRRKTWKELELEILLPAALGPTNCSSMMIFTTPIACVEL